MTGKTRTEWRLVVRTRDGRRKVYHRRDLAHAEKTVAEMRRHADTTPAPYMFGADVWIDSREVSEWSRLIPTLNMEEPT